MWLISHKKNYHLVVLLLLLYIFYGFLRWNQDTKSTHQKLPTLEVNPIWQKEEQNKLSQLIQERIKKLQNPKNCASTKKLVCKLGGDCGYGCQLHQSIYCLTKALNLQRTLIIESFGLNYSSKGWDGIFLPVSQNCRFRDSNDDQNIVLHFESYSHQQNLMSLVVPTVIATRLSRVNSNPLAWWIGQMAKYLMQFKPDVQREIESKKKRLGFDHPIVGVHIRKNDKNPDAPLHSFEEYMYWVDVYYSIQATLDPFQKPKVYLASEDLSAIKKARSKYPDYQFIIDDTPKTVPRFSERALHSIVFDIQMLSECDFIVCTLSSNVCRLSYEMMQAYSKHLDVSKSIKSLDNNYFFGQVLPKHNN